MNEKLAEATIANRIVACRQFFKVAVRRKLIPANPFTDVRTGSQKNPARLRFIDRETIARVMEACPTLEWRLIVALSRFGGLRCPTETLALRWSDIDWTVGNERIIVPSVKGEKHGKGYRPMPMFPELKPLLQAAWEAAPEGAVFVCPTYRDNLHVNLRTQFLRILRRAGVTPWPRLFHNLRASRETELADKFPLHVVTGWLGNTPDVAAGHYLQTTHEHFGKALTAETKLTNSRTCTLPESLARNPAQSASESGSQRQKRSPSAQQKTRRYRGFLFMTTVYNRA